MFYQTDFKAVLFIVILSTFRKKAETLFFNGNIVKKITDFQKEAILFVFYLIQLIKKAILFLVLSGVILFLCIKCADALYRFTPQEDAFSLSFMFFLYIHASLYFAMWDRSKKLEWDRSLKLKAEAKKAREPVRVGQMHLEFDLPLSLFKKVSDFLVFGGVLLIPVVLIFAMLSYFIFPVGVLVLVLSVWMSILSPSIAYMVFSAFPFIWWNRLTLKLKAETKKAKGPVGVNKIESKSDLPLSLFKKASKILVFGIIPFLLNSLLLDYLSYLGVGGFSLVLSYWVSIASLVVVYIVFRLFSASRDRLTLKLKAETKKAKGPVGVDEMGSESGPPLSLFKKASKILVFGIIPFLFNGLLLDCLSDLGRHGFSFLSVLSVLVLLLLVYIVFRLFSAYFHYGYIFCICCYVFIVLYFIIHLDTFPMVPNLWRFTTLIFLAYMFCILFSFIFRLFSARRRLLSDRQRLLSDRQRLLSDRQRLLSARRRLLSARRRLLSARRRLEAETKKAKGPVGVDEMRSESGPPLSFRQRLLSARRRLEAETEKAKGPVGVDEMRSESGPPLSFLKKVILFLLIIGALLASVMLGYVLPIRDDFLSREGSFFLILTFVVYIVFGLFFSDWWVCLLKAETKKAKEPVGSG